MSYNTLTYERLAISGYYVGKYPEYWDLIRQNLEPRMFMDRHTRAALSVMTKLAAENGHVPSQLELETELQLLGMKANEISAIFDEAALQGFDVVPPWDFNNWIKRVKENFVDRTVKEALEAGDLSAAREVLNDVSTDVIGPGGKFEKLSPLELLDPSLEIEEEDKMSVGFPDIDKKLVFTPGMLMIIAGKTFYGKSWLGQQILVHLANRFPVGFISIEMSKRMVRDRLINQIGKDGMEQVNERMAIFCPHTCDLRDIEDMTEGMVKDKPDTKVVLIDFLQLIKGRKTEARRLEVSEIVRGLKALAKKYDIGIILISQLSRNIDQRGLKSKPRLSDLKESGDIEYATDIAIFVHKEGQYKKEGMLIVAKNRMGEGPFKQDFYWNGERCRFEPRANISEDEMGNFVLEDDDPNVMDFEDEEVQCTAQKKLGSGCGFAE